MKEAAYGADRRARFWAKVARGGAQECWCWTGAISRTGHGVFWDGDRMDGAHRFALIVAGTDIPTGLHVLHRCDNPRCVNPAHLEIGTHAQNMRDMISRGRARKACGERSGAAKLSEVQVREIRHRAALGEGNSKIAAHFGVKTPSVRAIVLRLHWAHVAD